jgi:predicted nucleotidyltransferase
MALAREMARRIAMGQADVFRIILFGSFARDDYGTRSDLDLLVILKQCKKPVNERLADVLRHAGDYPADIFPLTEAELTSRLAAGDPFLNRAIKEGIILYPEQ